MIDGSVAKTPAIGQALERVEDDRLIQGRGCYAADVNRPNQLYARIVRSQVAHGRLRKVHLEDLRNLIGVVAAFCAEDILKIDELKIPVRHGEGPKDHLALQTPFAVDRVRYVGEPIAVVVATDPYVAEDAAEQVWAEIDEFVPALDALGLPPGGVPLYDGLPDNVVHTFNFVNGENIDELIGHADVLLHERFYTHRHSAVPMETRGLVADVDSISGRLTVWGPTKVKHFNRGVLAPLLGIPEEKIRFLEPDVGGGFGPGGEFYPEDFIIPWLALQLKRPVKWTEDRAENLVALNQSREHVIDLELAATANGQLLGFRSVDWCSIGAYVRTTGPIVSELAGKHMSGPYRWRGFTVKVLGVLTNKTPLGTYRGPGEVEATYARERMLDILAAKIEMDPAELRQKNLIPADAMPYHVDIGPDHEALDYESGDYHAMLGELLTRADYKKLKAEREERRSGGEAVGIGLACCLDESSLGPFEEARIVAEADGTFTGYIGVASVGQGVQTALAQILADQLGVDFARVRILHHDTDMTKHGFGASGSRTTSMAGSAIVTTVAKMKEQACREGAARLGVAEADVEIDGDEVHAKDGRSITLAALGCEETGRFEKTTNDFAFCTSLAFVAVDRPTGRVRVERYLGDYDVGRAINPRIVKGQLDGATAQGIAGALFEEFVYDEQGQPLCTSFLDYLMPTLADLPEVESRWHEYPNGDNLLGTKGASENGIIGSLGTIANAVADVLTPDGVTLTRLPLTSNNVRAMIRSARGAGS